MNRFRFLIGAAVLAFGLFAGSGTASAQWAHGGYYGSGSAGAYYGGTYGWGYGGYGGGGYRGGYGRRYHDTSHWDYHPPTVVPHGNHYHVQPGHYDWHQSGHYHGRRGHRGHYGY